MGVSSEMIEYLAHLARINLSEKEKKILPSQIKEIIRLIDQLKELDITQIQPMSHVLNIKNVLREDNLRPTLKPEEVFKYFPYHKDNQFIVPKVVE